MKIPLSSRTFVVVGLLASSLAFAPFAIAQGHGSAAHFKAKITAKRAEKNALKKYPGQVVGKVALENEDGQWQYSVNVKSGKVMREIMVSATTGKIASVERTSAREEAAEAAAEKKAAKHKK